MLPRYGIVQFSQKRYQAWPDIDGHLNDEDSPTSRGGVAMIDAASLLQSASSMSAVGFVLAEALVLYAGYGVLFERVGPSVTDRIEDE